MKFKYLPNSRTLRFEESAPTVLAFAVINLKTGELLWLFHDKDLVVTEHLLPTQFEPLSSWTAEFLQKQAVATKRGQDGRTLRAITLGQVPAGFVQAVPAAGTPRFDDASGLDVVAVVVPGVTDPISFTL